MPVLWFSSSPPVALKSNKCYNRGFLMTRRRCRVICFSWFGVQDKIYTRQKKSWIRFNCHTNRQWCDTNVWRFQPFNAEYVYWDTYITDTIFTQRHQSAKKADFYWIFPSIISSMNCIYIVLLATRSTLQDLTHSHTSGGGCHKLIKSDDHSH